MFNDTIVAIATPPGNGAISIIRLSGDDAIKIANNIFIKKDLKTVDSHTIHYGHIINPSTEEIIDEVMVTVMKAPRTYTKEDVVEINSHGGYYATNKVLEILLENGARISEPGEYTKRAFLNGRIDLAQAESVMDIINAKTDTSLKQAVKGVDGKVSNLINSLRDDLLAIIANIEVNIDYPEYDDVEELTRDVILPMTLKIKEDIEKVLSTAKTGQIIREGIKTAIIGRPNVGKSSLLNKLLREEKAIVTNIAGTTRDIVEGYINIKGVTLNLIDTAGIRGTEDVVEKIGVEKSYDVIKQAELILLLFNNNEELNKDDIKLLELTKNKNRIIIINKIDLDNKLDRSTFDSYIETSIVTNQGMEEIEEKVLELFNLTDISNKDMTYISNIRHIDNIKKALNAINDGLISINEYQPIDIIEIDIKQAWIDLGNVLGEEVGESLLDELFSKFCLGK